MTDPTPEEIEAWRMLWGQALVEGGADLQKALASYAVKVRDRTRRLLEEDPPPPGVVAEAVATIAGLAHALRAGVDNPTTANNPAWIGEQLYKALRPIRSVLRDATLRDVIRDASDDKDPKRRTPIKIPVQT